MFNSHVFNQRFKLSLLLNTTFDWPSYPGTLCKRALLIQYRNIYRGKRVCKWYYVKNIICIFFRRSACREESIADVEFLKQKRNVFFFVFVSRIIHSNFSQSCLVHVNEDIRRIQSTCTSYILSHVVCYGYHSCWSSQVGSIPYVERSNQNPYLL